VHPLRALVRGGKQRRQALVYALAESTQRFGERGRVVAT
jgi:hypothetical protein